MAAPSSILAWEIPRTEEPGGLQSMGHKQSDMTEWLSTCTHTHTHTHTHILGDNTHELQGNFNIRYITLKTCALCSVDQLCIIKDMATIISRLPYIQCANTFHKRNISKII